MTRITFVNGPAEGLAVKLPENEETWDMFVHGDWHRYRLDFESGQATFLESLVPTPRQRFVGTPGHPVTS